MLSMSTCLINTTSDCAPTPGGAGLEDSLYDDLEAASLEEDLGTSKAGDERTEIILAATFLLIVILSFVA